MSDGNPLADEEYSPSVGGLRPGRHVVPDWVLLVAGILLFWQLLHMAVGKEVLPSPLSTLREVRVLFGDSDFAGNLVATGEAFGWALLFAVFGGVGIGVLLGARRLAGEVAEPILLALYAIPKITLYPVILLMFGLGMPAKVAFGAIHGVFPVAIITMSAVRNIRPVLIRTARVMRLSPWQALAYVLVPAALPEISSGLRIGFALTLLGTLIGEMFASTRGIGFMLMHAMNSVEPRKIMALALLLFAFATVVNIGLLKLEGRLSHKASPS